MEEQLDASKKAKIDIVCHKKDDTGEEGKVSFFSKYSVGMESNYLCIR